MNCPDCFGRLVHRYENRWAKTYECVRCLTRVCFRELDGSFIPSSKLEHPWYPNDWLKLTNEEIEKMKKEIKFRITFKYNKDILFNRIVRLNVGLKKKNGTPSR